ncbi:multimeric flavodoxin WrbA [Bacilli bacterium PM5-3]|nr:multimeric flavodoxin WrbA [Bacilli bacterium PM5-3]MDH6604039.1 multimeric flavodoxin WrbA [Bacilli bacterium PM5-9]
MKTLIINGSPKVNGNTYHGATIIKEQLEKEGIDVEIYNLGDKKIAPCKACGACSQTKDKTCIIKDDLNELVLKAEEADGIILGSPIHYSDISGLAKSAYDRLFYVGGANGGLFRHKVGAGFVAVRRSGGSFGFHSLNNYFLISEMFVAPSSYWNIIHGRVPGEVHEDEEGVFTLTNLAENFAFLLKTINENKKELPNKVDKPMTNFVR